MFIVLLRLSKTISRSAGRKHGKHSCFLTGRKHIHAGIISIIHIVHRHFNRCARTGTFVSGRGATIIGSIMKRSVAYLVVAAGSIAPYMAKIHPMAYFMCGCSAFVEGRRGRCRKCQLHCHQLPPHRWKNCHQETGHSQDSHCDRLHTHIFSLVVGLVGFIPPLFVFFIASFNCQLVLVVLFRITWSRTNRTPIVAGFYAIVR